MNVLEETQKILKEREKAANAPVHSGYYKKANYFRYLPIYIVVGTLCLILICTCIKMALDHRTSTGAYPDKVLGVPVHTALIASGSKGRPGIKRQIKYIVIHETANTAAGADAKQHADFLLQGGEGYTSWHYTVDDHEIYHHVPDNEVAWHAGDRRTDGGGNMCGIGVELCVNQDGNFEKTFHNAAKLTAYLLKTYGLSINDVKQHADFMDKDCPKTIRDNGRWDEFLKLVKHYEWMV